MFGLTTVLWIPRLILGSRIWRFLLELLGVTFVELAIDMKLLYILWGVSSALSLELKRETPLGCHSLGCFLIDSGFNFNTFLIIGV